MLIETAAITDESKPQMAVYFVKLIRLQATTPIVFTTLSH
jgi:hypothetical protein